MKAVTLTREKWLSISNGKPVNREPGPRESPFLHTVTESPLYRKTAFTEKEN